MAISYVEVNPVPNTIFESPAEAVIREFEPFEEDKAPHLACTLLVLAIHEEPLFVENCAHKSAVVDKDALLATKMNLSYVDDKTVLVHVTAEAPEATVLSRRIKLPPSSAGSAVKFAAFPLLSSLVAIAVAIASYSASCSDPRIILEGLPDAKASLAVKFVDLV